MCHNELITPHGDREPNAEAGKEYLGPELITPHGDREPEILPGLSSADRENSLPLMGIGNSRVGSLVIVRGLYLITPHGDRELLSAVYQGKSRGCSLPLMGIGNWLMRC